MTWSFGKKIKNREMWVEFHECVHKTKHTTHVVCKHCSKSYTHPDCVGKAEEGGTTRSMSRHLTKCNSYNTKKNNKKISDFTSRVEEGQTTLDDYDNDEQRIGSGKFSITQRGRVFSFLVWPSLDLSDNLLKTIKSILSFEQQRLLRYKR